MTSLLCVLVIEIVVLLPDLKFLQLKENGLIFKIYLKLEEKHDRIDFSHKFQFWAF